MSSVRPERTHAIAAGVVLALLVVACGGTGSTATTVGGPTTAPSITTNAGGATTAATTTTTAAPVTTAAGATTTTTTAGPTTTASSDPAVIAEGEELFQRTAGGIGCAYCHTAAATGNPDLAAPDIRGKGYDAIVNQLVNNQNMSFIVLDNGQIEAIAAYLATLAP